MTNTFTISVVLVILTCNIVDSINNIEANIDEYINEVSLIIYDDLQYTQYFDNHRNSLYWSSIFRMSSQAEESTAFGCESGKN